MSPIRGWGRYRTSRLRVPRGVSGTFEVSPTGSIPRREDPTWQVTKDKVEASRTMLRCGQGAPKGIRPRTRLTSPPIMRASSDRNQISRPKVHGTRGGRRGRHDRFRLRFRLVANNAIRLRFRLVANNVIRLRFRL